MQRAATERAEAEATQQRILEEHAARREAWAQNVLDTHDALTDFYKHTRTAGEIAQALRALGLVDVVATYGGNGVEARARRAQ